MKSNQSVIDVLLDLGLSQTSEKGFYKGSDNTLGFNYCRILLIQNEFITIWIGKKDREIQQTILSMYYIKSPDDVIDVISRFGFLEHLFPNIVSVPEVNINS
jgi:hypothetical protein